ncbi:hypothetical protein BDF20DRAFT_844095 [Mycotypha africana]|uniref:uncharacterized protein n=1 Tax=Mycotypha africana TaxID=64632 RepID=UPI0023017369|nr:uncharacterized protein BDF20DRAFT_844095 [Mycotypha africana]KAI8991327.1 hypothetical protein BDF20DRAFT_844095 [Mycotypha africana]
MKKAAVLTGNRDLLAYYNLLPIYEKYVKPFSSADREGGIDPTLMPYFAKLPGKLDTEYDGYLLKILRDPQAVETGPEIRPLDADSLRRAFSLKEGPIPGFDASIFGSDEADTDDYSGQTVGGLDKDLYELDHNGERKHKKKVFRFTNIST